ncbi:hypothetical protein [Bacillus sp. CECT 9360]|nr:hypothetical protein [Bacillus sp. CECT 9360]CAH0345801.1 hypothetical protein BCI9360_02102 [Bacillus sp. CECT 9360]
MKKLILALALTACSFAFIGTVGTTTDFAAKKTTIYQHPIDPPL